MILLEYLLKEENYLTNLLVILNGQKNYLKFIK